MVKRILSIDGGGVRGIAICQFLCDLDAYLIENGTTLFDYFDMFAGTSTGALIISAIVYKKMSGSDLINKLYTHENAKTIMNGSDLKKKIHMLEQKPRYDGKGKKQILEKYLENITLQQSNGKDVLITAFKVGDENGNEKGPHIFRSWENGPNDPIFNIADVCNVTSSAPVYFPSVKINEIKKKDDNSIINNPKFIQGIDGGAFANNPTDCAYADAIKLYGSQEDIRIMSIGTGHFLDPVPIGYDWGAIQWFSQGSLLDLLITGTDEVTHNNVQEFAKALGHKYIRVNGRVKNSSMDDTSSENCESLKKSGSEWYALFKDKVIETLGPISNDVDSNYMFSNIFEKVKIYYSKKLNIYYSKN